MNAKTFREAFCERYGFAPEAFEQNVLWRCHHRRGLVFAKIFLWFDPNHYYNDLEMIRAVADCVTVEEVREEIGDFSYHHPNAGFWRGFLHVRLSGQHLVDMAADLLD